jgi:hypothetical protein
MEAYGLAHLGERQPGVGPEHVGTTDRVKELVCIGAAFGVNCVSSLKAHLEAAESVEISYNHHDREAFRVHQGKGGLACGAPGREPGQARGGL